MEFVIALLRSSKDGQLAQHNNATLHQLQLASTRRRIALALCRTDRRYAARACKLDGVLPIVGLKELLLYGYVDSLYTM